MKYNPYSVSRIGTFNTCPKKFKLQYIDKIRIESEQRLALDRGSFTHEILEHNFDYSIKPKLNHIFTQEEADKVINIVKKFRKTNLGKNIEKLINMDTSVREEDFAFNKKLELVDFYDKTSWFRGSADGYNVSFNQPLIWDYKTGKDKSEDEFFGDEQGMLYSIYLFLKFPEVLNIKVVFVFIEYSTSKSFYFERSKLKEYLRFFYDKTINIENTEIFKENISALCEYCDYNNTEHCLSFIENQMNTKSIMDSKISLDF
jgi:RecB family exonuclease